MGYELEYNREELSAVFELLTLWRGHYNQLLYLLISNTGPIPLTVTLLSLTTNMNVGGEEEEEEGRKTMMVHRSTHRIYYPSPTLLTAAS